MKPALKQKNVIVEFFLLCPIDLLSFVENRNTWDQNKDKKLSGTNQQ